MAGSRRCSARSAGQQALRASVDPGPALRERADRQARQLAAAGWMGLVYPLLVLTSLDDARWDRPALTVPASAVLAVLSAGLALVAVRSARDARRWLADPPGPPRELPPPWPWATVVRWCAVLGALFLPLGLVVGLVAG